ncbi:MAG: hypothetical protein DI527_18105 [Chelatococcus sp.]|nr:MAG: hypothetical protein DI527_18105 [Chelatococcus sp.]
MTLFPDLPPGTAVITACGRYRYRLAYELGGEGPSVSVGMINPSTADGVALDATMRKVIGFARMLRARQLVVWNLFAWRDKDVRALARAVDPVGPENDAWTERALRETEIRIVAWGPSAKLPARLRDRWRLATAIAAGAGAELQCWGTAGDGQPRHPLMLSYATPLTPWERPE